MAIDLRERQRVSRRRPTPEGRRPIVWPFVLTVIAAVVLASAAASFFAGDEDLPFDPALSYVDGAFTQVREGGPYVAIVSTGGVYPDTMIESREGGRYASPFDGVEP